MKKQVKLLIPPLALSVAIAGAGCSTTSTPGPQQQQLSLTNNLVDRVEWSFDEMLLTPCKNPFTLIKSEGADAKEAIPAEEMAYTRALDCFINHNKLVKDIKKKQSMIIDQD